MSQLALALPLSAQLAAEDFIVSECNRAAYDFVMRWPDWPAYGLVLTGPAGSGKTHLAELWRARSHGQVVEAFEAMDAQELFHLLERARLQNEPLLLTSKLPPQAWNIALADVRSRLNALPKAALREPDETLLEMLLMKLFSDRQLSVPKEVPAYLARRMERSFAAAIAVVKALDEAALAGRREITLPFAREVLNSFLIRDGGE